MRTGGKLERCDDLKLEHIRQDEDYEECSLDITSKSLVILMKTFPRGLVTQCPHGVVAG